MVFPANRIEKKNTINGARGVHPRIADRFDLTAECIRRHYLGIESPLAVVLASRAKDASSPGMPKKRSSVAAELGPQVDPVDCWHTPSIH